MKYESIRQTLIEKRESLEQRLQRTQKHLKHEEGPPDADFAEQAVERQNDDVIYGLDEAAKTELIQIKAALERIENEEYGICAECGEQIPYERLQAIPYTSYCKSCVEELGAELSG